MCLDAIVTQMSYSNAVKVGCHRDAFFFFLVLILRWAFISVHLFSPLHSKSFVFSSVPLQNELFVWLWQKRPPDGLGVISPGVLAYRPNIPMTSYL